MATHVRLANVIAASGEFDVGRVFFERIFDARDRSSASAIRKRRTVGPAADDGRRKARALSGRSPMPTLFGSLRRLAGDPGQDSLAYLLTPGGFKPL
jgi:hypothetical protein